MSSCHDPYTELEHYLQKAQEEIGKAVEELEQHAACSVWSDPDSPLLPPPPAFRSHTLGDRSSNRRHKWRNQSATLNRVCHDRKVREVCTSLRQLKNSFTTPYFAKIGPVVSTPHRNGYGDASKNYSPNTRRRLWQMHPSLSFPETRKDLSLLRTDDSVQQLKLSNESDSTCKAKLTNGVKDQRRMRQRSMSETMPPFRHRYAKAEEDDHAYPRPPSGDVNLLSIWADNLVLEIDKSLSGELNSASSFSPSSDYSLSPGKQEDCGSPKPMNCCEAKSPAAETSSSDFKLVAPSPDSGIEQVTCETPEDTVVAFQSNGWDDLDGIPCNDVLTPPPAEFGDAWPAKRDRETQVWPSRILKAAHCVLEDHESLVTHFETKEKFQAVASSVSVNHQEAIVTLTTTCVLTNAPSETEVADYGSVSHRSRSRQFSSLRKSGTPKRENWTTSLPKDAKRTSVPGDCFAIQRSSSSSAVSSISEVSMDELAAFMERLNTTTCAPPRLEDSSTYVQNPEITNKDAETQTTPVPLSRSSSFTWVTECDCSDWASEDSLGTDKKSQTVDGSRQSPLTVSSEEDAAGVKSSASNSSLYLSACSGSSDSFDESCPSGEMDITPAADPVRQNGLHPRPTTLADISEEHVVSDAVSMQSSDSCLQSPAELSASFPSALKCKRRTRYAQGPAQPIEPKVLVINELDAKSISAPVLLRPKRNGTSGLLTSSSSDSSPTSDSRYAEDASAKPRSHSSKESKELQAIEACTWLRAAGFPQYAQMYEDNQFPVDISYVERDHAFLEADAIQSLFRRLNTLNRCAKIKYLDSGPRKSQAEPDESDSDEQCALSAHWEFQRSSRRWSRIPSPADPLPRTQGGRKWLSPEDTYCSSRDSVFNDEQHSSPDSARRSTLRTHQQSWDGSPGGSSSGSGGTLEQEPTPSLRRSGSDRVRAGAKALLRRMESLKGKRKKKKGYDSPGSSNGSLTSSPQSLRHTAKPKKKGWSDCLLGDQDLQAHSDSECSGTTYSNVWQDVGRYDAQFLPHFVIPHGAIEVASGKHIKPSETFFKYVQDSGSRKKRDHLHPDDGSPRRHRRGPSPGRHRGHSPGRHRDPSPGHHDVSARVRITNGKRDSYYDNVAAPIVVFNEQCVRDLEDNHVLGKQEVPLLSELEAGDSQLEDIIIVDHHDRRDSGVGSSLTRGVAYEHAPWHCFPLGRNSAVEQVCRPVPVMELNCPQVLLVRKLSLLKLTTLMEKYSPSSKTGFSWSVPKFIRRRSPDYKDKPVFGVPPHVVLQRWGRPLPPTIEAAVDHLRHTALDAAGLFRKSGVRSRIQRLRLAAERDTQAMDLENQQPYDVADMLKQYFRDMPEVLLTAKLSETFVGIYQHIPVSLRFEAVQAAVMLMPDENREVLQCLLGFLREVCANEKVNQMSFTNVAVCVAPSLFKLSGAAGRSASVSPCTRRRKTVGVPDAKDLDENRAAYECLAAMLEDFHALFNVSDDMLANNRLSSVGHFEPATLPELSSIVRGGWQDYMEGCLQVLLKEAKERYRGWVHESQTAGIDISYKKLSDGHPLRLWKVSTEVEAPPPELLHRLLRERHVWDESVMKWRILERMDGNTEIFQHLCTSPPPHPDCDYCVLRSWRMELAKGACALIEASVDHPEAEVTGGAVRTVVLASRYLLEPCGSGKSRITHISRVDIRGRTPDWYNRAYGHTSAQLLVRLRDSFCLAQAEGRETKV